MGAARARWAGRLGLAVALGLAGCGEEGGGARRIRLSLILSESSEWFQGAARWKELVEARTEGRYRIEIVPSATRSARNQATELQMVQQGQLEASLESSILLATTDQRWMVFTYPWLFPNHAIANAVCDGPVGEEMLGLLQERNIVGLAYGANGFRQVTNSQRAIRTPADLRGLRIRLPQGLPPALFEHFGASTHQMNFGDLYIALERGELHGQENPLSVIHNAKLSAVQKHITLWNFVYDPIVLCVNREFWYSLPGRDQKVLRESAREAMAFERRLVAAADESLPAKLEAAGMVVTRLMDAERGAFQAQAAGLRGFFEKTVGRELLERFEGAVRQEVERAQRKDDDEEGSPGQP